MRYSEIILEAINVPYAFEVYDLIEDCITNSKAPEQLRILLEEKLQQYFRSKLSAISDTTLNIYIKDAPEKYSGVSGMFRYETEDKTGFPPVPENTIEIYAFFDEDQLESLLNKSSSWHEKAVKQLGSTIIHEFVHVVQYVRSNNKFTTLAKYTKRVKRPTIDGKRVGKRGSYNADEYSGGDNLTYFSTNTEIDAFAATTATEIVHQSRKYDNPKDYIEKTMRSLRDMSNTLTNYREMFQRFHLSLFSKKDPRTERQRQMVWKVFRLKLAKHLMDYLK